MNRLIAVLVIAIPAGAQTAPAVSEQYGETAHKLIEAALHDTEGLA